MRPVTSGRVRTLVAELTLEERCALLVGKDTWTVNGCERLHIPEWTASDGPNGVRGRHRGPGLVVPGPSALAATWNLDLVEQISVALATECLDRRVDLLLGPTTNMHRSPRGGRHFESFSEDPWLSSRLAVAYIRGVQSMGVGACIKHYVANDQETDRMTVDVEVDERTLREVYLAPFEAAVKEAGVRAVMAAYNYVNGDHACAHQELLNGVLKTEWQFDGLVISDWSALKDLLGPAEGGLDVEMPGPGRHWGSGRLLAAVERGDVSEAVIDDKAARVLTFLEWRNRLDAGTDHGEESIERPEHRSLARRAAAESTVLVRNDSGILPLARDRTVALIGPAVARTAIQGGGSAHLEPHRSPSLLAALAPELRDRLVGYVRGPDLRRLPRRPRREWLLGDEPVLIEAFDSVGFDGPRIGAGRGRHTAKIYLPANLPDHCSALSVRETVTVVPPESGRYAIAGVGVGDVAVYVDGRLVSDSRHDGFPIDIVMSVAPAVVELSQDEPCEIRVETVSGRQTTVFGGIDLRMSPVDDGFDHYCAAAEAAARAADTAVVVVGSTPQWESEGADRSDLELPAGQSELIARVAAANPDTVVVLNCGAPMDLPWFQDVAAVVLGWYPGQEGAHALADVLVGDAEPGGRMPTTWARSEADTPSFGNYPGRDGTVRYEEGLFVGYRHYDRHGIDPLIPFGHGTSYTTFEWGQPTVSGAGMKWLVSVPVRNTGPRAGSDVVQVYVGTAAARADVPDKQLAGFAKLAIEPGASGVASIELSERAFAHWDVATHGWRVVPGRYTVTVAASAADVRSVLAIDVSD